MDPRKERIADCFKKHINQLGFKKTSVTDISNELKISKKTIYELFSTKEKIFHYVIYRVAKTHKNSMTKKLENHQTAKDKIYELINMIFSESKKWLKKNDAFEFKYKYEIAEIAFKEAYNELFAELIKEGIKNGEFETTNTVELTICFINGIFSESMKLLSSNPDLEIEKNVSESILKLLN